MTVPLIVLAVGSVLAGMVWYGDFFGDNVGAFFAGAIFQGPENEVLEAAHKVPEWAATAPFVAMLLGAGTAWWFYIARPGIPPVLARTFAPAYRMLLNKYYFDEVYDFVFVRGARALGRILWKWGDGRVIDGTINGIAMGLVPRVTALARRMQSGLLYHYALVMVAGIVALLSWSLIAGGSN